MISEGIIFVIIFHSNYHLAEVADQVNTVSFVSGHRQFDLQHQHDEDQRKNSAGCRGYRLFAGRIRNQ
jgi:hypothetical protein